MNLVILAKMILFKSFIVSVIALNCCNCAIMKEPLYRTQLLFLDPAHQLLLLQIKHQHAAGLAATRSSSRYLGCFPWSDQNRVRILLASADILFKLLRKSLQSQIPLSPGAPKLVEPLSSTHTIRNGNERSAGPPSWPGAMAIFSVQRQT